MFYSFYELKPIETPPDFAALFVEDPRVHVIVYRHVDTGDLVAYVAKPDLRQ